MGPGVGAAGRAGAGRPAVGAPEPAGLTAPGVGGRVNDCVGTPGGLGDDGCAGPGLLGCAPPEARALSEDITGTVGLKGDTEDVAGACGEAPPGATPIIVFLPKPPADPKPVAAGAAGDAAGPEPPLTPGGPGGPGGVRPGDEGGAAGAAGVAEEAGVADVTGAPADGSPKPPSPPTPTIVDLRLRVTAARGDAPVTLAPGRGSAVALRSGDAAGDAGPASLRTMNECPHFEHRILSPEGGIRRSSIGYGALHDSHSTFSIPARPPSYHKGPGERRGVSAGPRVARADCRADVGPPFFAPGPSLVPRARAFLSPRLAPARVCRGSVTLGDIAVRCRKRTRGGMSLDSC